MPSEGDELRVVYADRWVVVVDKPHGLPSQESREGGASVVSELGRRYPYVALHHRLDTPASGLLVVAVHRAANRSLAQQFQAHHVERTYHAVLTGEVLPGTWDRPVQGREARTTVAAVATGAGLSACKLRPHTGRKHQLRIHAALAGNPICGDRRHGGEAGYRWPRLALHAAALTFAHPVTGERVTQRSALPPDLAPLWEECIAAGG